MSKKFKPLSPADKLLFIQVFARRLEMSLKGYSKEYFGDVLNEMESLIFNLNTPDGDKKPAYSAKKQEK